MYGQPVGRYGRMVSQPSYRWPGLRSVVMETTVRNQGIGSWPARQANASAQRTAIVFGEQEWTYAQLYERVSRLANALADLGVRHGDRVAYLGKNHPSFLETLFAANALGAIFVPLNFRLTGRELAYILGDADPRVFVYAEEYAATVGEIRDELRTPHEVVLAAPSKHARGYEQLVASADAAAPDPPVALDDTCMIMYTSGTTGRPKGVMLSHANITWNCANMLTDTDLRADEVSLLVAPLFHSAGLCMGCLPVLLKGGQAILESGFDVERALGLIEARRVTCFFGVPAMFNSLASSPRWPETDVSSLRILQCGGAPLPVATIRTYEQRGLGITQGYGLTETSPGALLLRSRDSLRKPGSAGTSHFFSDVRVVRPDMTDVSPGERGEVIVAGPNIMQGYWQLPDETAKVMTDGWFHSGDVATVDEEGYVYITDRIKDMIISGGENIYPAEVENALHDHDDVAECAVIGVADERWGEVGKAIVALRPGATASPDDILGFLDGRLARYKIPKSIELVEALPRNASGKILKTELRKTFAEQVADAVGGRR